MSRLPGQPGFTIGLGSTPQEIAAEASAAAVGQLGLLPGFTQAALSATSAIAERERAIRTAPGQRGTGFVAIAPPPIVGDRPAGTREDFGLGPRRAGAGCCPPPCATDFRLINSSAGTTPQRVLGGRRSRISLTVASFDNVTIELHPSNFQFAASGFAMFLLDAPGTLQVLQKDYGSLVGGEWWVSMTGVGGHFAVTEIYTV